MDQKQCSNVLDYANSFVFMSCLHKDAFEALFDKRYFTTIFFQWLVKTMIELKTRENFDFKNVGICFKENNENELLVHNAKYGGYFRFMNTCDISYFLVKML